MSGHSVLSPSGFGITVHCPGHVSMCMGITQDDTDDTREGDAVHLLGEHGLKNGTFSLTPQNAGIVMPNGVVTTEEMLDAALMYVTEVMTMAAGQELFIEVPVEMPEVHELCWGTPDAWFFDWSTMTLHVYDLKYGHSSVSAVENWQLMLYALGILRRYTNNDPLGEHGINVKFTIVQPRDYTGAGQVKRWEMPAVHLRAYVNKARAAAHEAMGTNPMLHVGDHCHHCPARHRCPAHQQAGAAQVDYAMAAIPNDIPSNALGYEWTVLDRALQIIKDRKEALETEALSRIKGGAQIPWLGIKFGQSRNKWLRDNSEIITVCNLMGVDVQKHSEIYTPDQVINKFKQAGVDPSVIKDYYGRQSTGAKLVYDDGSKAKQFFSKGE